MLFKPRFNRKTILGRMASILIVGAMAVVFQGVAYAHHPNIAATASCSNGIPVISYTASSWDPANTNNDGTNPDINILFDGAVVDTGAFVPPNFAFSDTLPAPAGTNKVDVQAVAAAPWADGWPAGRKCSSQACSMGHNFLRTGWQRLWFFSGRDAVRDGCGRV